MPVRPMFRPLAALLLAATAVLATPAVSAAAPDPAVGPRAVEDFFQLDHAPDATNSVELDVLANDKLDGSTILSVTIVDGSVAVGGEASSPGPLSTQGPTGPLVMDVTDRVDNLTFSYEVCALTGCSTAAARVDVVGAAPVAADDTLTIEWTDDLVELDVLVNDNLDGHDAQMEGFVDETLPGTVVERGPGSSFSLKLLTNGTGSFDYYVCTIVGCDEGRVTYTVTGAPAAPAAAPEAPPVPETVPTTVPTAAPATPVVAAELPYTGPGNNAAVAAAFAAAALSLHVLSRRRRS